MRSEKGNLSSQLLALMGTRKADPNPFTLQTKSNPDSLDFLHNCVHTHRSSSTPASRAFVRGVESANRHKAYKHWSLAKLDPQHYEVA
jgi:hypothetical protein